MSLYAVGVELSIDAIKRHSAAERGLEGGLAQEPGGAVLVYVPPPPPSDVEAALPRLRESQLGALRELWAGEVPAFGVFGTSFARSLAWRGPARRAHRWPRGHVPRTP